jgi:hypothetical protein
VTANANANRLRVCTYGASSRRSRSRSLAATGPAAGTLAPWADPLTGALGWQVRAPRAVGGNFKNAQKNETGEWQAQIPKSALTVTVIQADESALLLSLSPDDSPVILTIAVKPWTLGNVLKCQPEELPAHGTLSVREVRVKTRMGRIVRYLIPEFRPP